MARFEFPPSVAGRSPRHRYPLLGLAALLLCVPVFAPVSADDGAEAIRAEVRAGNAKRAEKMVEALIEAEPGNADAHHLHGEVLAARIGEVSMFRKMGMAGRMRKAWEQAIALDPTHVDAHMALVRYYLEAPAIAGGDRDKALELARRLADLDPRAGYRSMAAWLAADGQQAEAIEQYRQALVEFPDDRELLFEYALMNQGVADWDAAYAALAAILEMDPEDAQAHYQVGRTAVLSGIRLEEGAASLEAYLAQDADYGAPPHAWARTRLGQVYVLMERKADARAQFEAALALEPDHEEARKQLAALD